MPGSWNRVPTDFSAGDLGSGQRLESGVCKRVKNQNEQLGRQSCVPGVMLGLWRSQRPSPRTLGWGLCVSWVRQVAGPKP